MGRRMWDLWGEGITPSLQATGPGNLPSIGLAVGNSSRTCWSGDTLSSWGWESNHNCVPSQGTPRTKSCPTFLGVCRQSKGFYQGMVFLGKDPNGRF